MIISAIVLLFLSGIDFDHPIKNHPCEFPYIEYSKKDLIMRESWQKKYFSQIAEHNPDNFLYIIHKIDASHRLHAQMPTDSWTIKILNQPEILLNNPLISGSVITHEHLASAFAPESRLGFVLSSQCNLVGPSFYKDMFAQRPKKLQEVKQKWQELRRKYPRVYTPMELVTRLKGSFYYNEVTLIGTDPRNDSNQVELEALIIECPMEKKHLHKGSAALWSGKNEEILECLEGYAPKDQVYPLLVKLAKKYPVLMKAVLPRHENDLFKLSP